MPTFNKKAEMFEYKKMHAGNSNPLTNQYDWLKREYQRRINLYPEHAQFWKPLPYAVTSYLFDYWPDIVRRWAPHVSTTDTTLIAFFPTTRHIERMVPQKMKLGRFLKQYVQPMVQYYEPARLDDDKIRELAALMQPGHLTFHEDWQTMLQVSNSLEKSQNIGACMRYGINHWGELPDGGDCHPWMVYDHSDVAMVVLRAEDGQPLARAFYNKITRSYNRIFGQHEKMRPALEAAGFVNDGLEGAKIKKIAFRSGWLMPYIDQRCTTDSPRGAMYVEESTDSEGNPCWVLRNDGDDFYECNKHETVRLGGHICKCEICSDSIYDEDDEYYLDGEEITVCGSCYRHNTVQAHTRHGYSDSYSEEYAQANFIYINGEYYIDSIAAGCAGYRWSDYADEWLSEEDCIWCEDEDDYIPYDEVVSVDYKGDEPPYKRDYVYVGYTGQVIPWDDYEVTPEDDAEAA